jgi:hypothetical protein
MAVATGWTKRGILRTNFSNFVPHPSHRYSKMGMLFYSVNSEAILSIHLRTSEGGAEKLFTMMEKASHPRVLLSIYPDSAIARLNVPVLA